jgi:sialate O-acetylesterase
MELPMARLRDDFPEEYGQNPFPPIRQFMLPYTWDFSGPREDIPEARWLAAAPETLDVFSGTGWFFAKQLYEKLSMPIGIIVAAVGGAPIEAFMSREALAGFPEKIIRGGQYAEGAYREGVVKESALAIEGWNASVLEQDEGLKEGWSSPETPDSAWDTMVLPGPFSQKEELRDFCGPLWLRRNFVLPEEPGEGDLKIWLGTIVDADQVYINGSFAGETGYRYPPRKYTIPGRLLGKGENQITLRVVCNNGEGAVTPGKPFAIFRGPRPGPGAIELGGPWKYRSGARVGPRPREFAIHWQPMGLFNGMIAPLLRCPVRGALWYQGESNCDNAEEYEGLFSALIRDFRQKKGREDFPFLFVQLPLFGEPQENTEASSWAVLREAQCRALRFPATGMAAALDLGEWNDLHPVNKKEVGYRLAMAAIQGVYGKPGGAPGPMALAPASPAPAAAGPMAAGPMAADSRLEGNTLEISFSNCGGGLMVREGGGERREVFVSVVNGGGKTVRIPAALSCPDRLQVDLSGIEEPKKLLYAWADNPADRQLYNREGLPVIPFRLLIPRKQSREEEKQYGSNVQPVGI